MAGVEGEIDLAGEVGLVADARLESVAQLVVYGGGVVLVEVGTHDIDIGRKTAARMCLLVLLVGPLNLEVGAFLIVGGTFRPDFVHGKAQSQRAVESVALVVAESRLDAPRSACVDVFFVLLSWELVRRAARAAAAHRQWSCKLGQ